MIKTLNDFIIEYKKIQSSGWVLTHRSGNTGVGKTLEDLLGIPENNLHAPDFGIYELKAGREESNSLLTLFTLNPELCKENKGKFRNDYALWGGNSYLRIMYGYPSGKHGADEKVLHVTLSTKSFTNIANTGKKMKVSIDKKNLYIVDGDGNKLVFWSLEELKQKFKEKYVKSFVYANAAKKGRDKKEKFLYKEAYEVRGFDFSKFIALLKNGKIKVDVRIGQHHKGKDKGKIHDHGTAFRLKIDEHKNLFKQIV